MSRKQKWQENLLVHPNAGKSNQRKRREPTHPTLDLPRHTVPDRGHMSNCSTSRNSNSTSSSSVSGVNMNTVSSGSGGLSSNSTTKKSSSSCIACSTENNSDVASSSSSNSKRIAGGVHSASSSSISCSIKVSNGIHGGDGITSLGAKGSSASGGCNNNRRETGCSFSSTSSLGRGLEEKEAELSVRDGALLDSISNSSSPYTSSVSSCLSSPLSQLPDSSSTNDTKAREGTESGYSSLEKTRSDAEDIKTGCDPHYRRSQVLEQLENQNGMLSHSNEAYSPSSSSSSSSTLERDQDKRASRSEAQPLDRNHASGITRTSASTSRRSKSLERNLAEHTPTPDLLNFKKGWMTRLGEDGKWRKHWFVLTEQTLRFYRDSVAEEAADLDGEINLSTCYDITDFPVQRNYGFQIHTKDGVFTLCAMTYGIRRNWIQAVMKNVRPPVPPDVTSSAPQKAPLSSTPGHKGPSSSNTSCSEVEKRSRISERRKEGRYKTFDWAEFRHRQQKKEELSRQLQTGSEPACVPPAPASSPEEPMTAVLNEEPTETGRPYLQERKLHLRTSHMTMPTNTHPSLAHTDASINDASEENGQKRAVDGVGVCSDVSNTQVESMPKEEKKQAGYSTSASPASFSSSSVQTEWEWEAELQTLRSELKAEHERSEREVRDLQLSEAHLQAELMNGQDRLHEMESRLQSAEATLREKDDALEELRSRLEDVTGRLKATEEAQALKDVRLERHLRLLQESQERERRSLSDSLDQAEKRGRELEERLQQMEAELKNTPVVGKAQELERRCQELQNQLEESDSEVGRLQARLRNEETLYYNMEHDYEQVCEELECARGALQDCERVCEERFRTQLEKQQREINRKEQELQEMLVKMAALGTSLEETERRLKEAQSHLQKGSVSRDRPTEGQGHLGSSDIGQKVTNGGLGETETPSVAQKDESERVISVIQALESKLCNTEERLREITMHLQRQQQLQAFNDESPRKTGKSTESLNAEVTFDNLDGKQCSQAQCSQALHCLQGIMLERTAANANVNAVTNGMIYFQEDLQEASESPKRWLTLGMASRILSLETLVIQRMASAIERPSRELLRKLSELQVQAQALSEAQDGSDEKTVAGNCSQFLSCFQELDETSGFTLGQTEIFNLCVRAELAYLTYTLHTRNSEEQQGSDPFNLSPWPSSEDTPPGTRGEMGSKPNFRLADISPPELAPYSEQIQKSPEEEFRGGDMELQYKGCESLAAELRLQAQSLQALSVQLQREAGDVDMLPEFSPAVLQTILSRATLAYVTSRLRLAMQQELGILREQRERAVCECRAVCRSMEALFQEQTERYEEKLREGRVVIEMAELGRVSAETDAQIRGQEVQRLETEFEEKLQELQRIHEEEMTRLHGYYTQSRSQAMTPSDSSDGDENICGSAFKERIRELETQVSCLEDELRSGDANSLRQAYEQELETLKATCELGFSSMEQSHQRVIEEMQRQHQIEVERLTEEREKVLQEETNATIAAIEAMRKAHKDELEKSQKAQQSGANTDISKLRAQFDEELESLHRELEVLSEQYSQKCLENAHLSRTIETERQALSSTERENQELHTRNQELNKRLVAELSLMQSYMNGGVDHAQLPQGKDIYQLEVTLRVKESEIQCLKQEISSLKEELQAANRHSKELLKELSVLGANSPSDGAKRRTDPYSLQGYTYDLLKSRSNPEFMRERSKRKQAARSKSLRDGLSAQERIMLFESDDNRKI